MQKEDEQTFRVIGAAMQVHRELGSGFLEQVYHQAMRLELTDRDIPYASEVPIPIWYRGSRLEAVYRADILCFNNVVVELKALLSLTGREEAQLLHYLKATRLSKGLLLNFGSPSLQYKRMVR